MLERHVYIVRSTTSGQHALELLKMQKDMFDMLITDYVMPEMYGIELAEQGLNIPSDLPVLLCRSCYGGEEAKTALCP